MLAGRWSVLFQLFAHKALLDVSSSHFKTASGLARWLSQVRVRAGENPTLGKWLEFYIERLIKTSFQIEAVR